MLRAIMKNRTNRKLLIFVMIITLMCTTIIPIADVQAAGTNYYVGGSGASDSNPGTYSQPFATIQKAADVAVAGDVVNIRTGTYRETIIPANSGTADNPIVYQPDGDAVVTVSGADIADGDWSVYDGNIYQKTISLPVNGYNDHMTSNTTLMANQVFVDGKMMIEARWPNVSDSDNLMNRADWRDATEGTWLIDNGMNITDTGIPDIAGGWVGGQMWVTGWFISQSSSITYHSGSQINISKTIWDNKFIEYYYLTGRLGALDTAKEWFYDGTKLYLWSPDGGSPANVEVKKRNYAFDLNDKSYITINDINVFAASIITNISSTNITLDGVKAKYINHSVTLTDQDIIYTHTNETGIRVIGPNSIIKNSVVEYSSGQGIVLGTGNIADNNLVHDISYDGSYASGISPVPFTSDQKITHNTIFRTGRSCIDLYESKNVEIAYNDMYYYGLSSVDVGAIYSARFSDLTGTRVHHNWIHDGRTMAGAEGAQCGVYFDQGAGPVLVDHNVFWNNYVDYFSTPESTDLEWVYTAYNNTFGSTGYCSFLNYENPFTSINRNNIHRDQILSNDQSTYAIKQNTDPKFIGTGHGGLKYLLQPSSSAIDAGAVVAGVTDGHVGSAPDIGAYEYGGEAWVAGYSADGWVPDYYATEQPLPTPTPPPVNTSEPGTITIDDTETGTGENQYEFIGTWNASAPATAYMETDHYAWQTDDYYQVRFTGTQVKVYGEKNNAFCIVGISVDGGEETLVDSYSPTKLPDTLLYTSPVLPCGSHIVKVRLTGTKNADSAAYYHTADRVVVTTGILTIDDAETGTGENQYEFVGTWNASAPATAYMETDHYAWQTNDYYQVRFTGTQVKVYGEKNTAFCIVGISIDGGEETMVDSYSPIRYPNTLLYESPVLPYGSHIVKVRLTGEKNAASAAYYHTADRVVILTAETSMPTPNVTPIFDEIGDKSVDEGQFLTFTAVASDQNGDELTYSATNLPQGASFDAASGVFTWLTDYEKAGEYVVSIKASDGSLEAAADVKVVVRNVAAEELTVNLTDHINGLNLDKNKENLLVKQLENVTSALQMEQYKLAVTKLKVFMDEVKILSPMVISEDQAEYILKASLDISMAIKADAQGKDKTWTEKKVNEIIDWF